MKKLLLLLIFCTAVFAGEGHLSDGEVPDDGVGEAKISNRAKSELVSLVNRVAKDKFGLERDAETALKEKLYNQFHIVYPTLALLRDDTNDRDVKRTLTALLKDAADIDFKAIMKRSRELIRTKPEWAGALAVAKQTAEVQKGLLAGQYQSFSKPEMEDFLKRSGISVLDLEKFANGYWRFKTADTLGKMMEVSIDPSHETRVTPKNPAKVSLSETLTSLQQIRYKVESNPTLSVPFTLKWVPSDPSRSGGFMGTSESYSLTSEAAIWLKEAFRKESQRSAINAAKKDLIEEWTKGGFAYRDYVLEPS